jgi:hypothetical protein
MGWMNDIIPQRGREGKGTEKKFEMKIASAEPAECLAVTRN